MLTFEKIKATEKDSYAMVMFHGWGGNKESLKPLLNIFTFNLAIFALLNLLISSSVFPLNIFPHITSILPKLFCSFIITNPYQMHLVIIVYC